MRMRRHELTKPLLAIEDAEQQGRPPGRLKHVIQTFKTRETTFKQHVSKMSPLRHLMNDIDPPAKELSAD